MTNAPTTVPPCPGLSLFCLLSLLPLLNAASVDTADWPQFLGPLRDGRYRGPAVAPAWPKEGPSQIWQKETGQGFSGPVVAGDKLILFHRRANDEIVDCFNATNGQPLWSASYPTHYQDDFGFDEGPRATPTIRQGRVYTFGAQGLLASWDLADGKKIWSVDTKKRYRTPKGFFGRACSPLVESNVLILNLGGSGGAGIVAFDPKSGRELWKATETEASYASPVAARIQNERYAFVITREGLVCLNPVDGKLQFNFPWRPPMHASVSAATPLIINDLIFLSASYGTGATLLRFQPDQPETLWAKDDVLSNHYATSIYHRGFLYGFDGRQERGCNLRCADLRTGTVRWSQDRFGAGTLLIAGDRLLILTEKGELIDAPASPDAFNPTQRAQVTGFDTRAHPALANGLFYARDKKRLVCLDLRP